MTDLRKIGGSPLEISGDATMEQLRDAMKKRHKMINALMDIATQQITGKRFSKEMSRQLSNTADFLNSEIDAMEKILVEH